MTIELTQGGHRGASIPEAIRMLPQCQRVAAVHYRDRHPLVQALNSATYALEVEAVHTVPAVEDYLTTTGYVDHSRTTEVYEVAGRYYLASTGAEVSAADMAGLRAGTAIVDYRHGRLVEVVPV